METQEITLHVKLKTFYIDTLGYVSYVFENLEYQNHDYKYLTCCQFPNWNQPTINIEDEGFVSFRYVQEGIDTWFNGKTFEIFNNTILIFLKFIPLRPKLKNIIKVD